MISTRHGEANGDEAASTTMARTSSIRINVPSVRCTVTSVADLSSTVRQLWHSPQPGCVDPRSCHSRHSSAAAKARAAIERPDPAGPVISQAWVIPVPPVEAARAAAASSATASD